MHTTGHATQRTILKIKEGLRCFSGILPANSDTTIRAFFLRRVIEAERRGGVSAEAQLLKLKIMLEV